MQQLRNALIILAAVGFLVAAVSSLTGTSPMGVAPEGFSRACDNLALLSIALGMVIKKTS